MSGYQELPDHVRRIIERDGEMTFTPPSFERWLGRLYMLRTFTSMGAFMLVFLASYTHGQPWDGAALRAMVAGLAFHFFAWAAGLFVFGELYNAEVRRARHDLEEKERERARRIEEYYRERLRAQDSATAPTNVPGGVVPSLASMPTQPLQTTPIGQPQRYAA